MKNGKRIESITLKRMDDPDPDTSYLGEYSNHSDSEFSIDRKHDPECASQEFNHQQTVDKLERVIAYLNSVDRDPAVNPSDFHDAGIESAIDLLIEKQDELAECDCSKGYLERNSLPWFNPNYQNYAGLPHEEIVKYCLQDYERMESLNDGNWNYIGVRAESEVVINGTVQTITSGGLWGIESDSGNDYLGEIEQEQLSELRSTLYALGFSKRSIASAVKDVTRKES